MRLYLRTWCLCTLVPWRREATNRAANQPALYQSEASNILEAASILEVPVEALPSALPDVFQQIRR